MYCLGLIKQNRKKKLTSQSSHSILCTLIIYVQLLGIFVRKSSFLMVDKSHEIFSLSSNPQINA